MARAATAPDEHRYRWTRADYDRVIEAGGFGPEDRIELLDGELWEMTPQGSRHSAACDKVLFALQRVFTLGCFVRPGHPMALDGVSEPEPDFAVVGGVPGDHVEDHPSEALLVVEVSLSSLPYDRGRKLVAYARNGVAEYWIVDLTADKLEVYREPEGERYASVRGLAPGDTIAPLHAPDPPIAVNDLLP